MAAMGIRMGGSPLFRVRTRPPKDCGEQPSIKRAAALWYLPIGPSFR